jgi:hypothetical protein
MEWRGAMERLPAAPMSMEQVALAARTGLARAVPPEITAALAPEAQPPPQPGLDLREAGAQILETAAEKAMRRTSPTPLRSAAEIAMDAPITAEALGIPAEPAGPKPVIMPEGMIEEGLNMEHPDVAAKVDRYVMNNDATGIFDALKDPGYEVYRDDLHRLLRSVYGDEIPIARIAAYGSGGTGRSGGLAYVSVSTTPGWGKAAAKQGYDIWRGTVKPEDVILAGHEGEGELIVKKSGIKTEPEVPTPTAAAPVPAAIRTIPAPFAPSPRAGVARAITTQERILRGLAPAEAVIKESWPEAVDQARAVEADDPTAGRRLVDELAKDSRALRNTTENVVLLNEVLRRQAAHEAATDAYIKAPESLDARIRYERASQEVTQALDAADSTGTDWGRTGNIRKMLADRDFSYSRMEQQRLVARKGKGMSAEETAATKRVADQLEKARAQLDAIGKQTDLNNAFGEKADALLNDLQSKASGAKGLVSYMNEAAGRARERVVARRGRLYTGFDPVALADEIIIGASHIANGVSNFAAWSKRMISEFGERVSPYLKELFDRSNDMHEAGLRIANDNARMDKRLRTYRTRQAGRETFEQERLRRAKEMVKAGKPIAELSVKPQRRKLELGRQEVEANRRIEDLKREFFEMVAKDKRKHATGAEKAKMIGYEISAVPRALKASLDVSALRRQGGLFFASRPLTTLKTFGKTLSTIVPGARGERAFNNIMDDLKLRDNYKNGSYNEAKLSLTGLSKEKLSNVEEMFASNVIDRIPVLKHLIRPSERAYTAFLNKLRAEVYDSMAKSVSKRPGGALTVAEKRAIGNLVNVFTGRGSLPGRFEHAAVQFNQLFFAPRYVMSRFQAITGQPLWGKQMRGAKSARVAKVLGTEYARMIGGYMMQYALVAAFAQATGNRFGDMVNFDPRSVDFGKIKVGNTRIDPLAGLSQVSTLLGRVGTGEMAAIGGEVRPIRGEQVPFGKPTGADIAMRFLRSKLAPIPAALWDRLLTGKTFAGEPVGGWASIPQEAVNLLAPLSGNDIFQALKEQGLTKESALFGLGIFGDSVQTYSPRPLTEKQRLRKEMKERVKVY